MQAIARSELTRKPTTLREQDTNGALNLQPLGIVVGGNAGSENVHRPGRSAGQVLQVQREVADDLAGRDRGDRQIVRPQPHRRDGEHEAEEHGSGDPKRRRDDHRQLELHDGDRHRVGGDRHEGAIAEVRQAGDAELHQETEREDGVDPGRDEDEEPELDHQRSRALPKMPSGRRSSSRISATNASTTL